MEKEMERVNEHSTFEVLAAEGNGKWLVAREGCETKRGFDFF